MACHSMSCMQTLRASLGRDEAEPQVVRQVPGAVDVLAALRVAEPEVAHHLAHTHAAGCLAPCRDVGLQRSPAGPTEQHCGSQPAQRVPCGSSGTVHRFGQGPALATPRRLRSMVLR
eukprot:CAMPEP_0204580830 /NCGR_PEP_ID=MMETSP0661-20131031/44283_1 /ASSEMBLY_ACC=CAM_ASM_000606 /TAXON_ID=109239 /ORGANISM="Alexandrium margalefi, Strain AMGDE01CS-322" /LENGTH=116 /DNA_ID=CAMNT_0051589949 /DNA_START=11 /DNA_END=357 /DNA_ORIENTATION=-